MTGIPGLSTITDPESLSRVAKVSIHVAELAVPRPCSSRAFRIARAATATSGYRPSARPEADLIEADWLAFLRVPIARWFSRVSTIVNGW